ncbi:sorbitol dehydrogenase [Sodiomyces alkalinus F11]|uniref:Sorbitol dehydrogenase n=1 Tax=Sodiomyces alkalinus (strain CBS 110278 / VKM F-3762 / F11) TaxID=1314773 RepID=A0A3N2Q4G1_SODAK|nr:sorbitol dehydrogenase [Sodiomyces alkalinus F11]ROT41673.1 sorbitol dehydrogenase [Sodiomyces alkalinus F11]
MANITVQASVLHGVKDLRVEERPLPTPANGEVQVAVQATGLCGSDLHYFSHFRNGDILVREPLTLGHESAGVVTAIGPDVSTLAVGDRVALEVGQPCEACDLCLEGRYNICPSMKFRSSAKAFPHAQGTLQEKVNHPAKWCHKLPDNVSLELGAIVEALSVAMHAYDRAVLQGNATVLVLGAGAIGLLCSAVIRATGHKAIIADIQEDRVRFATDNGFAHAGVVVPPRRPASIEDKLSYAQEVAELVKAAQVEGKAAGQVKVTFECTGVETCMQTAIYSTRPGGKILIIGMGTPIQTLPISAAALREVDLVGVFRYANSYARAIELIAQRPPDLPPLEKLVTHRFSGLARIRDAFDMAAKVKDESGNLIIKVVVDMGAGPGDSR